MVSHSPPVRKTNIAGPWCDESAQTAHDRFRQLVLGAGYPCLGAASATRRGNYRHACYPPLASRAAIAACSNDLTSFIGDFPVAEHAVAILVAVFDGPFGIGEPVFEELLWAQLAGMRAVAPRADNGAGGTLAGRDDGDPGFGYGDRDFFVVGLHPSASRTARQFAWPTLVFNSLTHSEALQSAGRFELMQQRIRERDRRLHGTLNPNLKRPQLAQFSGREVEDEWACPIAIDPRGRSFER
jgi:hypothetical protein